MLYTTSYEPIKVWAISELKVHKKDINELGKVPSRTSCFYMFVSLPCLPEFLRWLISAEPTNHTNHEAPLCETNRIGYSSAQWGTNMALHQLLHKMKIQIWSKHVLPGKASIWIHLGGSSHSTSLCHWVIWVGLRRNLQESLVFANNITGSC